MSIAKTIIIAEAGVNHNGDLGLAKKLVDIAANSGADFIKFQSFSADSLVTKQAEKADYQKITTGSEESQHQMLSRLELTYEMHVELIGYCKLRKINFLSTAFDIKNVKLLSELGQEIFKIPSGEIQNLPYLRHIGRLGKEVILSTGMADLGEIEDALNVLTVEGIQKEKITVLHATTEYPCPIAEVNLRAMQTIQNAFGVKVGYSDHTQGIEVSIAAVAMGASVIEKHFTLDRTMEGPDHKASLEPDELKAMVRAIRNIDQAIGDGIKKASKSEAKNIPISRKSIVAAKPIKAGELFSPDNLTVKRPGVGINPMRWDEIIGQVAQRDYLPDEVL